MIGEEAIRVDLKKRSAEPTSIPQSILLDDTGLELGLALVRLKIRDYQLFWEFD